MSLMARLGCLDRDLVVEAIAALVPWKSRMRLMARFLSMAMISGPLAVRSWWWSSPVTTSLTDVEAVLDFLPQCPWTRAATVSGWAWSMGREQIGVDHLNARLFSGCLSAAVLARVLTVPGGSGASDPDHLGGCGEARPLGCFDGFDGASHPPPMRGVDPGGGEVDGTFFWGSLLSVLRRVFWFPLTVRR